ncbi:MAG: hypothetical protein ABEJ30_03060 [Halorientalis sp.]
MVARGWSPTQRQRIGFHLGVGLLLVFNPFLVQQFGLGGPTHAYAAVPAEPTGDRIDIQQFTADTVPYGSEVHGVDCYLLDRPWTCTLETRALRNGSVTVGGVGSYDRRPRASFVRLDGAFYRRTVTGAEETVTVSYDRVSARELLATVSVGLEHTRPVYRRAVRDGRATAGREHDVSQFVRTPEGYYLVGPVGSWQGVPGRWTLSLVGSAVGLVALRRGHRQYLAA